MAGGSWWEDRPGLRQVFGAVYQAAQESLGVTGAWNYAKDTANDIASQVLSVTLGREPTEDEIAERATGILRGVSIFNMNDAYGAAKGLVVAHDALAAIGPSEQITSEMIGRPPWATTTNVAGVQEQYRIRVQRQVSVTGATYPGRPEWATYNLSGPLSSIQDALNQANQLFEGADYNRNTRVDQILDYQIEAI